MTKLQFTTLTFIFLLVLAFLQYQLWFEPDGILDLISFKKKLHKQAVKAEIAKKRNETLLFQVERLQNSKDAVESRARNELGMIKKDETFYQIVK